MGPELFQQMMSLQNIGVNELNKKIGSDLVFFSIVAVSRFTRNK